ncbi:MAG: adenylate/guanylate cyclase domain-containing protein [Chloroflexi bacterium]|nr:MAG: adenylate/guanylate cyclase domain-containing protein [Chloroflexota bacterium]
MVRERVGDWRLAWRFALAGLIAGILVSTFAYTGLISRSFDAAQDQLYPAPAADSRITLIAIDQRSKDDLGAYPWLNSYHAKVINYLASLHPKVILFDVVLDHLTPTDPEDPSAKPDAELAAAIQSAGNVVLVCTADDAPRPEFSTVAAVVGDRGLGYPDAADSIRGVELRPAKTCPENEGDEPAFIEALRISEGINVPLVTNRAGTETTFGPHHIPLVGNQMLINFTNGSGPSCAYVDALNAGCPHPESITGHIVVVGTKLIDAGDVYSQAVSFPHEDNFCPMTRPKCMLGNQNYGYRILGDAMSTILSDRYLRVQPPLSLYLAVLLLSAIVGLVVYLPSFRNGMVLTAGILVAYFAVIEVLGQSGYLSDPLYAPIAIALAATFSLGARYVLEERERRKVELIFGHWVDPRIARQLAASKSIDEIISRGERRDLTMLFVDIRGFTAMSEAMRAEDVLAVIQDYLEELTALIFKWDGTIDKYVGDEIVAIWNAPVAQPSHALLALRCAYDLVNSAPTLLAKLAAKGLPPISWGVGINTGPAVVGNMGSKDRLQYTALGDTVNTAARFCGAAEPFTAIIGQPTFDACAQLVAVDQVPGIQLKGKSAETFRVFRVSAIREEATSPWVPFPTNAAMAAYSAQKRLYAWQAVFAAGPADS